MNLNELTIKDALLGLKNKDFSSLDLTKSCLERIKKVDNKLNAFITVSEKEATEMAKEADDRRKNGSKAPLLGIPFAVKDLYLTKGVKTTAGSHVLENYIGQYDATAITRLNEAGAVLLGKLNCDAWAHGSSGENSDFGPILNPYDLERTPGGSSSGSAVSVAASESLMAMGTDTGGSIRLPASFCNVVGLKPTYGRVSRYGVVAMASSLDSIGHLTKTVSDSAIVLNVTAGHDIKDANTPDVEVPDYTKEINTGVKDIKIGVPKEYFTSGLDGNIKREIEKALNVYEKLGAKIAEISLPHSKYALAIYYILQTSEVSSNLARYDGIRYGKERSEFGDEAKRRIMLGTFALSAGYYEAYYIKALKGKELLKSDFDEVFKKVDVILAPVSPTLPFRLGEKTNDPLEMYLSDIFTVTANLVGIPGLSVPGGFINDLPLGFQILGPHFSESKLFRVGKAYEKETNWYQRKPII